MQLLLGSFSTDRRESGRINSDGDDIETGKGPGLKRTWSRRKNRRLGRMNRFFQWQNHPNQAKKTLFLLALLLLTLLAVIRLLDLSPSGFYLSDFGQPLAKLDKSRSHYPYAELQNLVMVAGHAVYTSSSCEKASDERAWYLEAYQKYPGQASSFVAHIETGVHVASEDPKALLLFSGGETRKDAGPRSEAQSYWAVADTHQWFGKSEVSRRALTEEFARDSFENLLFSICRFRELTGRYPGNVTVVSYDFKRKRFAELHRSALAWPVKRFRYFGTPPPAFAIKGFIEGEAATRSLFQADPYGCRGVLHEKRLRRDPFARTVPYPSGCPEMQPLFEYCGTTLYPHRLPWDITIHSP